MQQSLRLTEIFHSLQGESVRVGLPTVFVRLTGCPLRCQYCDTAYAFQGGKVHPVEEIIALIDSYNCEHICVTGGEPLAQVACVTLLKLLCDKNYKVSLETSGARDISQVDPRVMIVMDLKTPDSKECSKNLFSNLQFLKPDDQIKFVICSRADYEWSCKIIQEYSLIDKVGLLFSPSWGEVNPSDLAEWILSDRLKVRFQLQLHKILWPDTPGR